MKDNIKDWIQYSSAIAMLASAIVLALWSFSKLDEVHSTVLTYSGIAVSFVSAVFGLALYARNEIRREVRKIHDSDLKKEEENEDTED